MIIDKIANAENYYHVVKNFDKAITFINSNFDMPLGRHEFEGGAVISSQITSAHISERNFESHKNFADIMIIIDGEETVSYCNINDLQVVNDYDFGADVAFYNGGKDITVTVPSGYFYIVMPDEGHKPCIHTSQPGNIKKYVVKCDQR